MNKSRSMPEKVEDDDDVGELERYGQVLREFEDMEREKDEPRPSQRRSILGFARSLKSGSRSTSLPFVSPVASKKSPSSSDIRNLKCGKFRFSERTPTVASTSSFSSMEHDSSELAIEAQSSVSIDADRGLMDETLGRENRRLKKRIEDLERHITQCRNEDSGAQSEEDTDKLNRKIRILKSKRKDERTKLVQLEKIIKAHSIEIEGLQRELSDALDAVDELKKQRSSDRSRISRLTSQVKDAHLLSPISTLGNVECNPCNKIPELEKMRKMLDTKSTRILQLQGELEYARKSTNEDQERRQRMVDRSISPELRECQTECAMLRRKNAKLELIVQELAECNAKISQAGSLDDDFDDSSRQDDLSHFEVSVKTADSFEKEIGSFTMEGSQTSVGFTAMS